MSHQFLCDFWYNISIHALREEGDLERQQNQQAKQLISIHALREEGDLLSGVGDLAAVISIHALREEGDLCAQSIAVAAAGFLSTPSARRATLHFSTAKADSSYFYPRPPRGGRLARANE